MKNHTNTPIDRDRAFDINAINELLTQGKAILTQAITISQRMENSIAAIASIYSGIDGEYQVDALGSDINALSGRLRRDIYQETVTRMDTILTKLINDIPSYDTALAQSMDDIQETLHTVKGRINELRSLLDAGNVDLSYPQFSQRLQDLKAGWDMTTEDLAQLLTEIENDMLGVSAAAVQYSKDPVNLSTGNFVYDHEDIRINGEIPLTFHRYYNARSRGKGSLGRCFVHNYEIRLEQDPEKGKATVTMGDGQKKTFRRTPEGAYQSLHSALETLTKEGDNYVLETLTGEKTLFDQSGQMTRQENRNARGTTFTYDAAGRLQKAETDNHTSLTYTYDENGHLTRVTDHTGRYVELTYEKGKLATVKTPQGSTYAYRYAKNGRIEQTVNPRGHTTVKNTYDEKRRVTRQEFPDGGHMDYAYDDAKRQVILTERNGSKITYLHDSRYRNTDILYEDGTREHFAYNEKNQKTLHTDRNGNTTRMSYDNRGNLTQLINALGEKLTVTYDALGNPINIKINGKEKQKNTYDPKGNLTETEDALSRRTCFTYNTAGLPETVTYPDGSTIYIQYDGKNNITGITDPTGAKTAYAYDTLGRAVQITDPCGNPTSLTYDQADNLLTLTNPAGDTRSFTYNESNKVTTVTDFDGSTVRRTYTPLNKPETLTDQQGRTTRLTYDAMWNPVSVILPDGSQTHYRYDQNNRLTQIEDALGNTINYTYDGNGNRTGQTDQMGNTTRFTYDALGRLTHVQRGQATEMTYAYDGEGHLTEIQDALGNKVLLEYDQAGQLIRETNTLGNSRAYTYTPLGKTQSVTDEAGRTTRYAYLPGGLLSAIHHSDGTTETYTYDPAGNIHTRTDRNDITTTYAYDCLGRVTRATNSAGAKKEYTYDPVGNLTAMTDACGNTTRYAYTLTGQLLKVTDALGNETEYAYDPCDRLIEIRQYGEGINGTDEDLLHAQKHNRDNRICHITRYQRNLLGQVETITDPLGHTEHYTYDPKGQLLEKLDKEGYLTKYAYTPQGDIDHITYADGREVRLSYNPLRQLEEIQDWLGTTTIQNDPMGRALKVQYPDGKQVSYSYGKSGERTAITYPDGKTASYTYDSQLRLSRLTDENGSIAYAYDEKGRLTQKTFPNGMQTAYAYNAQGRLTELTHTDQEGILDRYTYRYDLTGNKTAIQKHRRGLPEESGAYTYTYDALGRLSAVTKNDELLRTYAYDAFGNRSLLREGNTQTTYAYNAMNQLVSRVDAMNEETYTYDKRGNLRLILQNGALKNQYTYGALNRLEQTINAKGETALYTYNGLGHRVGKTTGTQPMTGTPPTLSTQPTINTRQTPDQNQDPLQGIPVPDPLSLLESQDIHPEKKIQYTIDLTRGYNNLLQKEEDGNTQSYLWDGNVTGLRENGQESYYLQDELGSPIRLANQNGELEESYGYDEFGPNLYGNQGITQPFGYTGYQPDRIAETYYAQAREYRPELGRFAAADTIKGFTAAPYTLNGYGYCWNNPMMFIDSDGMIPQWIIDAINGPGLPEWLERIIEGNEAHRLLQKKFMKDYGKKGGVVEFYIASGVDRNPSGTGRADIIYFNASTKTAEVYEIKPLVTYAPLLKYNEQGVEQMKGYVSALNRTILKNQWGAEPGTTLNEYFNKIVIDSEMYEGKEIVYRVFQNGMITYYYRDKNLEKEIVVVPKNAKEKLKEIYENLGIEWEKQEDLVKILTYSAIFILAVIACVGSGGALAPEVAGLFLLFILLTNNGVTEQEGCIEA